MSQAISNERFREIVRTAEDRECARIGAPLPVARESLARRWKVAAGTLFNIRRGRIKDPKTSIVQRIGAGVLRDLESEITRLTHERQLLVQCGFSPDGSEMHEVENVLEKVRQAHDAINKWKRAP